MGNGRKKVIGSGKDGTGILRGARRHRLKLGGWSCPIVRGDRTKVMERFLACTRVARSCQGAWAGRAKFPLLDGFSFFV